MVAFASNSINFGRRLNNQPPNNQWRLQGLARRAQNYMKTRMCANAQRDGRPAEHRWRPLFNATPQSLADAHYLTAVQQRCQDAKASEISWGCPKLVNRSQPPVGLSSPYCGDIWRTYCCLTCFSHCRIVPSLRRYSPTNLCDGAQMAIFGDLRPVFPASRVQTISDLHSKFALRPHHVWKYGRHPISDG